MPDSTFVYESGVAVSVGSPGVHDYEFVEGTSLLDSGGSSLVFVSGTGLGGATVIDDFERGDLSPYSIHGGNWSVSTTKAYDGTQAVYAYNSNNTSIYSLAGLPYYPVQGDIVEFYVNLNHYDDAGELDLGVQTDTGSSRNENQYEFAIESNAGSSTPAGSVHCAKRLNGNWDIGPIRTGPDAPLHEWIRGEIQWGNPTFTFTAYTQDAGGNFTNVLGQVQMTDTQWTSGGIGWSASQSSGDPTQVYMDGAKKIGVV